MARTKETKRKYKKIGIDKLNSISALEIEIMKIVWNQEKVTVRKVHETMLKKEIEDNKEEFTPYTTVMSTMTALADKGLLKQDKREKTYIYTANVDQRELSKSLIMSVAENLLENNAQKMVIDFLEDNQNISSKGVEKLIKKIDKS
ncbi:MAG: BlaI/MecI/CopY family transcriptional regulator [Actinomycetota bacterium]|nr:BlaI/MecI/CopY family transcriptional regulator [Actinomycetota bacterium]